MLAATGGIASAAEGRPDLLGRSTHPANIVHPKKKGATLVDQTSGGAGIGIVSQTFQSSFSIYDAADADAFVVPTGKTWTVTSIVAAGTYFNGSGPATSEDVTFYADKKGVPGAVVKAFPSVKGKDSAGTFTIAIPKLKLKAGTYWVSVVANLSFGGSPSGEWGWNDATDTGPHQADWENPGGGFGIGCTTWTAEATCIPDGQANGKDYELLGKSK